MIISTFVGLFLLFMIGFFAVLIVGETVRAIWMRVSIARSERPALQMEKAHVHA